MKTFFKPCYIPKSGWSESNFKKSTESEKVWLLRNVLNISVIKALSNGFAVKIRGDTFVMRNPKK